MKKNRYIWHLAILVLISGILACHKDLEVVQTTQTQHDSTQVHPDSSQTKHDTTQAKTDTTAKPVPYPQTTVSGCSYSPDYGDSILFPQPGNGKNNIVSPVNSPPAGKYYSWPSGMVIDSSTGAINVGQSASGQRYAIGFVKSGTKDTCLSSLIIGGVDYMDSIYVIADGQTEAVPYFNANPYLPNECQGNSNKCAFDINGSAARMKVIVDNNTGVIDLQKTLNGSGILGGAFGLLPYNGQTITINLSYKLPDRSNNSMQHLNVQFQYYNSKSDIGQGLLNSLWDKLTNILNMQLISTSSNPRPPLVFIVRKN